MRYVRVWMDVPAHTCWCMGEPWVNVRFFLSWCPTYCWDKSLTELGAHRLHGLAGQWTAGIHSAVTPQNTQMCAAIPGFYIRTRYPGLYQLSYAPSPKNTPHTFLVRCSAADTGTEISLKMELLSWVGWGSPEIQHRIARGPGTQEHLWLLCKFEASLGTWDPVSKEQNKNLKKINK